MPGRIRVKPFRYNGEMTEKQRQNQILTPVLIAIAVIAAAGGFYFSLKLEQQQLQQAAIPGLFWPNPKQLTQFETVDQDGGQFGLEQLRGKWSFLFFGYTNCPDICPITLSVLANAYPQLKQVSEQTQLVFVSVDPERDESQLLNQYVKYFHPDMIGLGGSQQQIQAMTRQLGIVYFINNEADQENYLVDHSASIFLIDPLGRLVGKIAPPHEANAISLQFKQIKEFIDAT